MMQSVDPGFIQDCLDLPSRNNKFLEIKIGKLYFCPYGQEGIFEYHFRASCGLPYYTASKWHSIDKTERSQIINQSHSQYLKTEKSHTKNTRKISYPLDVSQGGVLINPGV